MSQGRMKTILAIETSCDETAVAVLRDRKLLASEVASQVEAHQQFGGVVPELASRNHLVHLPRLLEQSLAKAQITIQEPHISLIVSGGHTLLVKVVAVGDYKILGRTLDDAAGEAFDKIAKLLGLGYPGGPEIERRAASGDAGRFDLPRAMLDSGDLNFSFSGLKTAMRYLLPKLGDCNVLHSVRDDQLLADLCASFQRAVIDVLCEKSLEAVRRTGLNRLTLSGGVSSNRALRENLRGACDQSGIELIIAEPWLCTDNAAMIAFAAMQRLNSADISDLAEEIDPNLALA